MSLFVQAPESHPFSVHTAMEVFKIKKGNGGKLAASFLVTQDGGAMLFGDEIQPDSAALTIKNSGISKSDTLIARSAFAFTASLSLQFKLQELSFQASVCKGYEMPILF